MGNVRSVFNALTYIGEDAVLTSQLAKIENSSRIILPGVGAFGQAMANLEERGLIEVLNRQILEKGKPFLGICLGMQLIATRSYEHGIYNGLGWIDAEVVKFLQNSPAVKLPHMGWNDIIPMIEHPFLANLQQSNRMFYFVHSYHVKCNNSDIIAAQCEYGYKFTAVVIKNNIVATQFHPEKSQDNGLQLLENFVRWNP